MSEDPPERPRERPRRLRSRGREGSGEGGRPVGRRRGEAASGRAELGPATRPGWLVAAVVAVAIQSGVALLTNVNQIRSWPPGSSSRFGDTDIYHGYATRALRGEVPYRDFLVEYPPLAMPLFLLPALAAPGLVGFRWAFAIEMLACNAATVGLVAWWVARREGEARVWPRLAWHTTIVLLLSRLLISRYDAAPMLLGVASAIAWETGRAGLGGVAAGLGALAKIYPGLIAMAAGPGELARSGPRRGRGLAAFGLTVLAGSAAWLALGGVRGVRASLGYHAGRGLEYGSPLSGLQMLAAKLSGRAIVISRDHASFSSVTPWSPALTAWAFPIQAAAVGLVVAIASRRRTRDLVRDSGAATLAFALAGKVFSPQYLLWVLPFLAALEGPIGPRARRLFALGCGLTLLAPSLFNVLPKASGWVILAFNLKNAVLLALLGFLALGPERR